MARASTIRQTARATKQETRPLREKAREMYRQAILDAAEHIFATEGIRTARIQDIAARAGVSVGTVYNHFEQKEDIITALFQEHDRQLHEAVASRPDDPHDFEQALRARADRVFHLVRDHREFFSFALHEGIFDSGLVPPDSAFHKERFGHDECFSTDMRALLKQGIRQGSIEPPDPVRLERFLSGVMRSAMIPAVMNLELDPVLEGRFVLDLFFKAVRPRGKRP